MGPHGPKAATWHEHIGSRSKAMRSIRDTHPSAAVRRQLNKVFPTHWSFLLGEIALYSLHRPAAHRRVPDAVLRPVDGRGHLQRRVSAAARRRDVEGLRVHAGHQLRGARRPVRAARSTTGRRCCSPRRSWCTWPASSSPARSAGRAKPTGSSARLLLILAMFEGYFGYSLPDDLLSGTGLRAALSSITLCMPVVGTWVHWALFGGDFPCGSVGSSARGRCTAPRSTRCHLLVPGIILALIGVHLALVWFQKHTQFPGPGAPRRTSSACASCRCSRSSPARSSR